MAAGLMVIRLKVLNEAGRIRRRGGRCPDRVDELVCHVIEGPSRDLESDELVAVEQPLRRSGICQQWHLPDGREDAASHLAVPPGMIRVTAAGTASWQVGETSTG